MNQSDVDRFWANVVKGDGDECWLWIGSVTKGTTGRTRGGYGKIKIGQKRVYAHRMSFVIHGGELTDERPMVLHSCHNRLCVNPSHLRAGNHTENMIDRRRR